MGQDAKQTKHMHEVFIFTTRTDNNYVYFLKSRAIVTIKVTVAYLKEQRFVYLNVGTVTFKYIPKGKET